MASKVRDQIKRKRRSILHHIEMIMSDLREIETLANGQSEYIDGMMVYSVVMTDRYRDGMKDFLRKL